MVLAVTPSFAADKANDVFTALKIEANLWEATAAVAVFAASGNETPAQLQQLNRMTLMFSAFEGDPLALRVYGSAALLHPRDTGWDDLIGLFPTMDGSRQIIDVAIERVETSCGSGVPFHEFKGQRGETELVPHYDRMDEKTLRRSRTDKNTQSIDGFPANILD